MAILDARNEFCDATALSTAGTGRALIGSQIDLSVARDIGNGQPPLYLGIQVTTAVTSGGSATVSFILASDASASVAVDGTATEHIVTADIAVADLVVGYALYIPLPPEASNAYERYLGLLQNVGTAALTAGAINAFLTPTPPTWKAYPDNTE